MEWTSGDREESGHRIFDVGNDYACTLEIYEVPMHDAADKRSRRFVFRPGRDGRTKGIPRSEMHRSPIKRTWTGLKKITSMNVSTVT